MRTNPIHHTDMLDVTATLNTEINKWKLVKRPKQRRNIRKNINRVIDGLLLAPTLSCFVFNDQSIAKICIAASLTQRSEVIAEILDRLNSVCCVSEDSACALLFHIVERLDANTIIFYMKRLIVFGLDKQMLCNHVYEKIFHYASQKHHIGEEQIGPILQSLKDIGFVATSDAVFSIYLNILCSPYPAETCLKYLYGVNYSDMPKENVECIFNRCIMGRLSLPVIYSLCELDLVPDPAFILKTIVDRSSITDMYKQASLNEIFSVMLRNQPAIIPIVIQLRDITERYQRFYELIPDYSVSVLRFPAEYILLGINDDYYVQHGDIKLYGIQWNPITKQLETFGQSHWRAFFVSRDGFLFRLQSMFSQCLLG